MISGYSQFMETAIEKYPILSEVSDLVVVVHPLRTFVHLPWPQGTCGGKRWFHSCHGIAIYVGKRWEETKFCWT